MSLTSVLVVLVADDDVLILLCLLFSVVAWIGTKDAPNWVVRNGPSETLQPTVLTGENGSRDFKMGFLFSWGIEGVRNVGLKSLHLSCLTMFILWVCKLSGEEETPLLSV